MNVRLKQTTPVGGNWRKLREYLVIDKATGRTIGRVYSTITSSKSVVFWQAVGSFGNTLGMAQMKRADAVEKVVKAASPGCVVVAS